MKRSEMFTKFVGAFCLALLFAVSASAQEYEIVPGQRIGSIELGMTRKAVHAKLGNPSGTYSLRGRGYRGDYWFSSDNSNTLRVFYNGAGRVFQISVTSARFTTPEGLNTRSSLADIRRSYKNLKVLRMSARGDIDYYYDPSRGIAFELTDHMDAHSARLTMQLYAILVFRPGSSPQSEPDEFFR
ncbi:MAG: hypothetical protein M3362_20895 [Acidobacteriota bacterium]|nr:hypothetical protein [Acidobacteriota bacterium]